MNADNFSLEHYFDRIGFTGEVKTDIHTLTKIMRQQLFTVPFENLDVQAKKTISLIPENIVEKIIYNRRGGYCYEVNGLFSIVLRNLGIPYQFVAARPIFSAVQRPRTHLVLVAQIEGKAWLFDLGFGSTGIRAPISLDTLNTEIQQDFDTYMLSKVDERVYLLRARIEDEWLDQYSFDLSHHEWVDFAPANHFNSTHPDSLFVKQLLVVQHNESGRTILVGDMLKTVIGSTVTKQTVDSSAYKASLKDRFNLVWPD
ncbi:arylamine N-acetyltransferase family protein [Chitinimonas sp. PSY-7]|uniref:arylamine N-acetyltransferase n=1 Tax=Chitinimonas sp. PSY-7 TaxID=3459088 RepID=UPI00403FDECB